MKLSREWLSEFTDINASDKEYSDRMTMSGSKVEGVEVTGGRISNVIAGRVREIKRHENSDHLWVCTVDVGSAPLRTIITGAQNVKQDDMVPVAVDGAVLFDGKVIRTGVLRGLESQGMLCSLEELGLDSHDYPYAEEDGIFILEEPCEIGDSIIDVLGLGDSVYEFEITSNRPDCLSVRGLARESAAVFGKKLTLKEPVLSDCCDDIAKHLSISIEDSNLCPRYTAMMVKNIKIGPSPVWMRRRLRASGVRPINNIVDITNYVMLEYGQPMHAFDYACVSGGEIIVRSAKAGESVTTLDGNKRSLKEGMLLITDPAKPVGIAGVMGGENSEITADTRMIVFESANFNGTSIRKTALALGLRTDASGKYEKGLDPMNTLPAVKRACELVQLLGAGEVIEGIIDIMSPFKVPVTIPLDTEKINKLLGTDIDKEFMKNTLTVLGFETEGDMVTPPSWRGDIEHYADLAEEVARFYGYDIIKPTMFSGETMQGGYSDKQLFERSAGEAARAMGFYEVLTYSFTGSYAWDKVHIPEDSPLRRSFVIQNPLGEDTAVMRTTSLPSMMEVIATNIAKRSMQARLYELATIYLPCDDTELAQERVILTLGAYGEDMDFFALKGMVEALLVHIRAEGARFRAVKDNPSYHPGRCAELFINGISAGIIGQVHPSVCSEYEITGEVFAAELDMQLLQSLRAPEHTFIPLPKYPAVTRDIAVVCDLELPVSELLDCITGAGGALLEQCRLFDIYTGASIPDGKKSAAFSLTLRASEKTLTDKAADEIMAAVLEALEKKHGAVIR